MILQLASELYVVLSWLARSQIPNTNDPNEQFGA